MTSNFVCGSVASRAHSIVKQAAVHQSSRHLGQKGTVAPAAPWLFSMFFVLRLRSLFSVKKKNGAKYYNLIPLQHPAAKFQFPCFAPWLAGQEGQLQ
jgi:hypothetical protein